jgi:hypothetical protein
VIPQRGVGLAARLANAWADAGGPGVQIGMDTPQVTACDLDQLLALVAPGHSVLGRACDGGWWVIGLPSMDPSTDLPIDPAAVFTGIPMSTPLTGDRQERRLRDLGLTVRRAAVRRDIDTAADLAAVADEAPGTRTAVLATALGLHRAVSAVSAVRAVSAAVA